MTDAGFPTDSSEDAEETASGAIADALAGVAAALSGEAPSEDTADSTADDSTEASAAEVTKDDSDDYVIEVNEDSPFAAAAAIFTAPKEDEVETVAEDEPDADAESAAEAESTTDADSTSDAESTTDADSAPADDSAAAADEEASEVDVDADAGDGEEDEEEAEELLPPASPYDLPGAWYVIHSYSGYENKVQANLGTRIKSMHMENSIFDIVIPMEEVVEIKNGRKVTVPRKQFPGYILVRMYMDDDSWGVVRNTPGVTGFVGSETRPTPLSRREVERILGVRKDEEKKAPRFKPDWEVGETVRVLDGPFADFNGIIEDINVDQSKVRVLVDIFGRETPVELNFEQIQKF